MNRKLRSVLDLLNPNLTEKVELSQSTQKISHDKKSQCRSFVLGDTVYARSYGQGPLWVNGTITDVLGHNFIVEVNHSGQLYQWKRHVDQLKKHFTVSSSEVPNILQKPTDATNISEGEEEDDKMSGIIEIWPSQNSDETSPQQQQPPNLNTQPNVSSNMPRRNPPRDRKPPDRLT